MSVGSRHRRAIAGRVRVTAAVAVFAIGGCAAPSAKPAVPSAVSQVSGTVTSSPACPGPVALDSPCPARPLADASVEATRGGTVTATTTTDSTGHYTLSLPAGTYQIVATSTGGYRAHATRNVAVPPDAHVDLTVDSGMR